MSEKVLIELEIDQDLDKFLSKKFPQVIDYRIISQSLDARGSNRGKKPRYHYQLEVIKEGQRFTKHQEDFKDLGPLPQKPIIVGAGPAGLFCALRLTEYGAPSILIERGARAQDRMKKIAKFWRYGQFDSENNVCFGEGGAGLFSDGKLITRIKSPFVKYVMQKLVDFGAPPETAYMSNPHLGSNKIRLLINQISDYLISKGCEIHYDVRVDELLYEDQKVVGVKLNNGKELLSQHTVLATGHSAKEIYHHLEEFKVAMEPKDFAIGVRIEHPRRLIDYIQYGEFSKSYNLSGARYRLSYQNPDSKKGTYSFCMCPGGYVLSSGTDWDGIVVNGMSNFARNSPWSNAALVVSVKSGVDFPQEELLSGLKYARKIEHDAYLLSKEKASGKEIPAVTLKDFLEDTPGKSKLPKTSCPSGIFKANLNQILPESVTQHLRVALNNFDRKLKGFISNDALLLAPETRTSAPVTIIRDRETLESTSHQGLYPCGEGAGHAGGITSAAVDGVKVAMSILKLK